MKNRLMWLLFFLFSAGQANAIYPDPTGVWHDPAAPGTGVSVVQQGEVLFVTMFVYDEQRRPTWYVASNVRFNGVHLDPGGGLVHAGDLYRTTGAWFGQAFDASQSTVTRVGNLVLYVQRFSRDRVMSLRYTVDGRDVFRDLRPLNFDSDAVMLRGNYDYVARLTTLEQPACVVRLGTQGTLSSTRTAAGLMRLSMSFPGNTCVAEAPLESAGKLARFEGNLQCTDFLAGKLIIDDITTTFIGFIATIHLSGGGCTQQGRIAAVSYP